MKQRLFAVASTLALATVLAMTEPARAGISEREDAGASRTQVTTAHHRAAHKPARKRTKVAKGQPARPGKDRSVSLAGVVAPLAAKAREIVSQCGSTIVSARSRRGNRSNHPSGRAVDITGNPACIYAHLKGWPGGVSTDYARAPGGPHVHVSYAPGGQEWGLRFAHRKPNRMFAAYVARRQ